MCSTCAVTYNTDTLALHVPECVLYVDWYHPPESAEATVHWLPRRGELEFSLGSCGEKNLM